MNKRDLEIIESTVSIKRALADLKQLTEGDGANNGYYEKIGESLNAISEMEKLFLQVVAKRL